MRKKINNKSKTRKILMKKKGTKYSVFYVDYCSQCRFQTLNQPMDSILYLREKY